MLFEPNAILDSITEAMKAGDAEATRAGLEKLTYGMEEKSNAKIKELEDTIKAMTVPAKKVMSKAEKEFFTAWQNALKHPQDSITQGKDLPIPEEVINRVLEGLTDSEDVLSVCDVQTVKGKVTTLTNVDTSEKAAWGELFSGITQELSMGVDSETITLKKLTAWIPVPNDYADLGIDFMSTYATTKLVQSVKNAINDAVANNLGVKAPVGMIADVDKGTTGTGDTEAYASKEAIAVTEFSPEVIGELKAKLAKDKNDRHRSVGEVFIMVNPEDNMTKITPATTILTPNGSYATNVFPTPVRVVENKYVPAGKAIFGRVNAYHFVIGFGGNSGLIRYSDDVKFFDDARVYAIKMIANGQPKDGNSFLLLDISKLETPSIKVVIDNKTE